MNVAEAFSLVALGSRQAMEISARQCAGVPKALIRAILAQYDGDVDGAIRTLKHLLLVAKNEDRAYLADMLAPILIMRHENSKVLELADHLTSAGWGSCADACRALVAADEGDVELARRFSLRATQRLNEIDDDVVRCRVTQRLARTAYYLHEYEESLDLALRSAASAARLGGWRVSAAGYSIAYNIHHNVTGDILEADRFARSWREAAVKSGDESFIQSALVAEYELAVNFDDVSRIVALEDLLRSRLLPQQYMERFPLAISHALVRGKTDLVGMRTLLQVLRDTPGRVRGQAALCVAMVALADAALLDDANSRVHIREAISLLGRPLKREPAYEQRYRRLARVFVAAACTLIGDDVRAQRIVGAAETRVGERVEDIPARMKESRWETIPSSLRGVAEVIIAAQTERRAEFIPAGLTQSEFEVLRLLASGWSAGRIANETDRSVNTVYNHTRAILSKLDASRATEAVAIARERGMLT
jgi:DNA-binding CsgD family transcriptional regulator